MNEWMLILLDIVTNSLEANSKVVKLTVKETKDSLDIYIEDDGKGISKENQEKVFSPFYTTRTTRDKGFGLPFLKEMVARSHGTLKFTSEENKGTKIDIKVRLDDVDSLPVGSIEETVFAIVTNSQNVDIVFRYSYEENSYFLDTREIKKVLEIKEIIEPDVTGWIKENLWEGVKKARKGK